MVDPEIEGQIERGLMAGQISHRRLAAEVGISRGTVNAMAAGTRPMDLARRRALRRDPERPLLLEVARCGRCGRLIEQPCRVCRDELALESRGPRDRGPETDEPPTIALRDENAERYLALRHEYERRFVERVLDQAELDAEQEEQDAPTEAELAEIEKGSRR